MKETDLNLQEENNTLSNVSLEIAYEEKMSEVQRLSAELDDLAQDEAVLTYIREKLLPNALPENVEAYIKGRLGLHSNELTDDQRDAITYALRLATDNGPSEETSYAA